MKNYKLFLATFLLPTIVFAQSSGRDEASQLCTKLTFSSDKDACLKIVREGEYFSARAAKVCTGVTFGSDAVSCMKAIRDKDYMSAEIDRCAKETFGSSTTDCFKTNGKSYKKAEPSRERERESRISDQDILRELRQIERDVRDERRTRALDDLRDLIRRVERR